MRWSGTNTRQNNVKKQNSMDGSGSNYRRNRWIFHGRIEAKLSHIDNAMRTARSGLLHSETNEWSEDVDRSPTIPEGSTVSTSVDASGTGGGGPIGV